MTLQFHNSIPADNKLPIHLISGDISRGFGNSEFIWLLEGYSIKHVLEIRHEYFVHRNKQVVIIGSKIAVGHYGHFYFYDFENVKPLVIEEMDGYFGCLEINDQELFVASAGDVSCYSESGGLIWKSVAIALDGIVITKIDHHQILGSGEWDPPGGWRDFILDRSTGRSIC